MIFQLNAQFREKFFFGQTCNMTHISLVLAFLFLIGSVSPFGEAKHDVLDELLTEYLFQPFKVRLLPLIESGILSVETHNEDIDLLDCL